MLCFYVLQAAVEAQILAPAAVQTAVWLSDLFEQAVLIMHACLNSQTEVTRVILLITQLVASNDIELNTVTSMPTWVCTIDHSYHDKISTVHHSSYASFLSSPYLL